MSDEVNTIPTPDDGSRDTSELSMKKGINALIEQNVTLAVKDQLSKYIPRLIGEHFDIDAQKIVSGATIDKYIEDKIQQYLEIEGDSEYEKITSSIDDLLVKTGHLTSEQLAFSSKIANQIIEIVEHDLLKGEFKDIVRQMKINAEKDRVGKTQQAGSWSQIIKKQRVHEIHVN